jgi:hypothetical protein
LIENDILGIILLFNPSSSRIFFIEKLNMVEKNKQRDDSCVSKRKSHPFVTNIFDSLESPLEHRHEDPSYHPHILESNEYAHEKPSAQQLPHN